MAMIHSAGVAKSLRCHQARNINPERDCLADGCMAWEWLEEAAGWIVTRPGKGPERLPHQARPPTPPGGSVDPAPPDDQRGFCSLLGRLPEKTSQP